MAEGGHDVDIAMLDADTPTYPGMSPLAQELVMLARLGGALPPAVAVGVAELDRLPDAVAALEAATGLRLDDPHAPLLLSVRSSFGHLRPGNRAVVDIGITSGTLAGVAARLGDERAAHDARRRFLERYGSVVCGLPDATFVPARAAAADLVGTDHLPVDALRHVCNRHEEQIEASGGLPVSSLERLRRIIEALSDRFVGPRPAGGAAVQPDHDGEVVLQAMAHGLPASGSTFVSSRDPASGATVAHAPGVADLLRLAEVERRDAYELDLVTAPSGEATIIGGRVAARSGTAAFRIAHDLVADGEIALTRAEAIGRITADHVEQILHPTFDEGDAPEPVTSGLGASPGAAAGAVAFSSDDAARRAAGGESVILVAQETSPEDMHGMEAAAGILTTRGGLASHAAVVARGWGTPAVCGAEEIQIGDETMSINGQLVRAGDQLSIDGSTGAVYLGSLTMTSTEPRPEFGTMLEWADEIRAGKLTVRANADTGADATAARGFGAEGIGLCRTEHMFLAEDRLPIMRQMILAATPGKEKMALARLRLAQRDDFVALLEAMDGLPVTVRLLDPPLHEFLPDLEELVVADARGELDAAGQDLLAAARVWHEQNPMIGTRGVRLAWLKPGLYEMQVTALVDAVNQRLAAGGDPHVEVMIPLTVSGPELEGARGWVEDALAAGDIEPGRITIGTMVETPRAALRAAELAEHADFFSFGTNDLTQLTFGFSRDDVESRLMGRYLDEGLIEANPFEHLDEAGVGDLVRQAAEAGRAAKPGLKLGVCGEHGGDPASIAFLYRCGLDYVSCSPYRVPVARLAAAQAVLASASAE